MRRISIDNVYQFAAFVLFFVGMILSYFFAEIDDAPGVIIAGLFFFGVLFMVLYGIGNLIEKTKENTEMLVYLMENKK